MGKYTYVLYVNKSGHAVVMRLVSNRSGLDERMSAFVGSEEKNLAKAMTDIQDTDVHRIRASFKIDVE